MSHLCTWQSSINFSSISLSCPFLNSNKMSVPAASCSKKFYNLTTHGVWSHFLLLVTSVSFIWSPLLLVLEMSEHSDSCPHYSWFYRPASNSLPLSHLVSSPMNSQIKAVHHFIQIIKEGKKASAKKEWKSSCVRAGWQKRTGYLYTQKDQQRTDLLFLPQ